MNKVIIQGDCIEKLKKLDDNSIDSVVTDPPYGLGFMNKEWDSPAEHRRLVEREKRRSEQRKKEGKSPTSAPFTSCVRPGLPIKGAREGKWYQDWYCMVMKQCLRVLKPGGHLLSFGGTRTYHRMACAIEDAGFEIRDMIEWVYGSGFPKSLNIGNAIAKREGAKREGAKREGAGTRGNTFPLKKDYQDFTKTENSKKYEGWGTALKPAHEPICLARKPLSEKSVAENVLKHKTGGINIDECRIPTEENLNGGMYSGEGLAKTNADHKWGFQKRDGQYQQPIGRFPANLIHDGSDEVVGLFPNTNPSRAGIRKNAEIKEWKGGKSFTHKYQELEVPYNDSGSASRFFYCAKASKQERNRGCEGLEEKPSGCIEARNRESGKGQFEGKKPIGRNNHPTVKPLALMKYLVRLITPRGGTVLDPFMGSGTTGMAAKELGFNFMGIEKEKEYCKIAEARIKATAKPLL